MMLLLAVGDKSLLLCAERIASVWSIVTDVFTVLALVRNSCMARVVSLSSAGEMPTGQPLY